MERRDKVLIIVGVVGLLSAIIVLLLIGFLGKDIYGSEIINKNAAFNCDKCLDKYCQPYYTRTKNINTLTKSLCKDLFRVKDCSCTGLCSGCGSTSTNCNNTLPPGGEDAYCDQFPS
jgi:hypothetical protein